MGRTSNSLNSTIRATGPMASPPDKPKKKMGRPPKIEKERIKARERGGVPRPLPQSEIDEIQSMTAAARIETDAECRVCALSPKKLAQCEEDILVITSGNTTVDGLNQLSQAALKYGVKTVELMRHRDKCMVKEAVLVLDKVPAKNGSKATDIDNSAAWIGRLVKYLSVVDSVIEAEQEKDIPDPRVLLSAAEAGRKTCETNAKLFLDLYKLRIDKRVQDDFIRIVLETVEKVAPAAKDEIIRQLKGRLAMATAAGLGGV